VGVILNLSVWFTLHVLFAKVREVEAGPFDTLVPAWTTLQPVALGLSLLAGWLLLVRHLGMVTVLALMAALGGVLHLGGLL
jgi:chromate transporter